MASDRTLTELLKNNSGLPELFQEAAVILNASTIYAAGVGTTNLNPLP